MSKNDGKCLPSFFLLLKLNFRFIDHTMNQNCINHLIEFIKNFIANLTFSFSSKLFKLLIKAGENNDIMNIWNRNILEISA